MKKEKVNYMKTLIVYGSTYGFTKDCVQKLAGQLEGDVVTANAMTEEIPNANQFDNVIVGGSIYMGQIQKKIKEFCAANEKLLSSKKLGLFLCCGLPENLEQSMKNSFPESLMGKAAAKGCFGGELRMNRMKLMHKMISNMMLKAAEKEGKKPPEPIYGNIAVFADAMRQ